MTKNPLWRNNQIYFSDISNDNSYIYIGMYDLDPRREVSYMYMFVKKSEPKPLYMELTLTMIRDSGDSYRTRHNWNGEIKDVDPR